MKKFISIIFLLTAAIALHSQMASGQNSARPAGRNNSIANDSIASLETLIAKLPASDAVIGVDIAALRNTALPSVLGNDVSLLADANSMFAEIKETYGIDLTAFDLAAVGIGIRQVRDKEFDFQPVAVVRGTANANEMIAALVRQGKLNVSSEAIAGKTVYIIRSKQANGASTDAPANPESKKKAYFAGLQREFALAALDDRTFAVGLPERVRQTIKSPGRVDPQITALMRKTPAGAIRFAARSPRGISNLLPLDSDDLGQSIESIRFVYGGVTVGQESTQIDASGITTTSEAAALLKDTLEGVQSLGKALLGNSKGADKALYRRLLENASFSAKANEVTFHLGIPHADLKGLIAMLAR